mgnify:CR=1 FL=1
MTEKRTCKERIVRTYWSIVGIAGALILSLQPVLADDIWSRFSTIMKDVYGEHIHHCSRYSGFGRPAHSDDLTQSARRG